jgi:hypothetical protein
MIRRCEPRGDINGNELAIRSKWHDAAYDRGNSQSHFHCIGEPGPHFHECTEYTWQGVSKNLPAGSWGQSSKQIALVNLVPRSLTRAFLKHPVEYIIECIKKTLILLNMSLKKLQPNLYYVIAQNQLKNLLGSYNEYIFLKYVELWWKTTQKLIILLTHFMSSLTHVLFKEVFLRKFQKSIFPPEMVD